LDDYVNPHLYLHDPYGCFFGHSEFSLYLITVIYRKITPENVLELEGRINHLELELDSKTRKLELAISRIQKEMGRDANYICSICGETFTRRSSGNRHNLHLHDNSSLITPFHQEVAETISKVS
jgi:hypothetical protein